MSKKPKIGYFIRSRGLGGVAFDEVYVYGPTRRSDEGIVGHDLRVRPTRLGPGTYTSVVSPDDVEWAKPVGHQPATHATKKSPAQLDRDIADSLAKNYRVHVRVEGALKPVHVSAWMTHAQAEDAAKNHKAMIRNRGWTQVVEIEDKSGAVTRLR